MTTDDYFFEDILKDFDAPKGWIGCSWKDDELPSFYSNGYMIFVNHLSHDDREKKFGKEGNLFRFYVILEYEYEHDAWSFFSNDIDEVKKELKIFILERPLYHEDSHADYLKQMQVWAS
tara:strand:- start:335 stop:691 length:357 start_codon:yes stop_codon:yes gene_type:complete